jgi:hypothetical protein
VTSSTSDQPSRVVLLGDSIFANAAYTHGEPDVLAHLRRVLPPDWRATLCAVRFGDTPHAALQTARNPGPFTATAGIGLRDGELPRRSRVEAARRYR